MRPTIKQISSYLPYIVKCEYILSDVIKLQATQRDEIRECVLNKDNVTFILNNCKLKLKPLNLVDKKDLDYMYFQIISTDNDMYGSRDEFEDFFNETHPYHLPMCLVNYLLEKHYDVFGMIQNKQAIANE